MNNNNNLFSKIDYTLIFIVFLLFCVSLVAIYKAPVPASLQYNNYVIQQLIWYIIGSCAVVAVFFIDYERFKMLCWVLYGFFLVLLVGLVAYKYAGVPVPFAFGSHGAVSWYQFKGLGNIQPAEFMKIVLILVIAQVISKHNELRLEPTIREDVLLLGKILLVSVPPLALILIQPDLGTDMVFTGIIGAMILVSGIRWRILIGLLLLLILGLVVFIYSFFKFPWLVKLLLEGHQLDRFYGWLDPYAYSNGEGFQLINSLNAIGSGELYGRGLDTPSVFLPEGFNDFIFSVIGGAFGFVGASVLIAIFFLLIYRIIHAALKTHDPFGSYICTGIIGMLTFTIFENIGMTIQVMPITGIPLPFISYGGSSLLSNMISIGFVLSIEARSRKFMFD